MGKTRENSTISKGSGGQDLAREARLTLRQAFTGSLATVDGDSGYPFASLVSVAVSPVGDPIMLLSGLARHTKNIAIDGKASLLLEASVGSGDPLESSRITVQGDVDKTTSDAVRKRYLGRHPEAANYADFSDFAFYTLKITKAHFIAGFGRIHALTRDVLCLEDDSTVEFSLNDYRLTQSDQATLKQAWRRQVGSAPQADHLEVVAFDRDGFDVKNGEAVQRVNFPTMMAPGTTLQQGIKVFEKSDANQ